MIKIDIYGAEAALDTIASALEFREDNQPGPTHVQRRAALRELVAGKIFERGLAEAIADPSWVLA